MLTLSDPVYTKANDSGFVANPECFDIGFVLPFTLRDMNPIQNYHREIMNPEVSNPEKFAGSLDPRKFESDKLAPSYGFQLFQLQVSVHKMSRPVVMRYTIYLL